MTDRRSQFFSVLGIEDNGRRELLMTREEYLKFGKPEKTRPLSLDKPVVQVYFEFEPYADASYSYCPDDDVVYVDRFYIGD